MIAVDRREREPDEARRALERIRALHAVTAALSRAATPGAVAEVFVSRGAEAIGASGSLVRLAAPGGASLELEATMGYPEEFARSHASLPLTSPLPGARVFRTGRGEFLESGGAAAFPAFGTAPEPAGHEAIAFVPLEGHRERIGVLAMSFAEARVFDDVDREFLTALASQCAQALERAALYEAELRARVDAERAIEQASHLQSLAAELAVALTTVEVSEVVVRSGVAATDADAGALYLLNHDENVLAMVDAHGSDPSLVDGWRWLPIDSDTGSTHALRSLEPVFIESEDDIRSAFPAPASGRTRVRAGAHVPLLVSGTALGVLFLGFAAPREFSESQRAFVLALGRQCAQALRRAQLYEAELGGRNRLNELLEALQDGVISVNRRGQVEFANSVARRMLLPMPLESGRVPEAWLGFPLRSFVSDLFGAGEQPVEVQVASPDGERTFDLTGIRAPGSGSALVVVHDASERERRRRAEREFVANAAHELRTPLAGITSAVERLQAGARDVPESRDRYLGHLERESDRLNRLAASLLTLARAQTREEEPRRSEIELRPLLAELLADLDLGLDVELELDCPPGLVLHANRDLVEHVVLNLASNAARHTRRGRIRVTAAVEDGGHAVIAIADTGDGIPAAELERIFDRFYRGAGGDGGAGFGLGLAIARDAAQAMGGRVEIESVAGSGTTARLLLPPLRGPVPA